MRACISHHLGKDFLYVWHKGSVDSEVILLDFHMNVLFHQAQLSSCSEWTNLTVLIRVEDSKGQFLYINLYLFFKDVLFIWKKATERTTEGKGDAGSPLSRKPWAEANV